MEDLVIHTTNSTPDILFSVAKQKLTIKGICTPENPKSFFDPVVNKLFEFQNSYTTLTIEINLEYFNSGSSKALLTLFIEASKKINPLKIIWISSDEELKEAGAILEEITGLPFEYIDEIPQ